MYAVSLTADKGSEIAKKIFLGKSPREIKPITLITSDNYNNPEGIDHEVEIVIPFEKKGSTIIGNECKTDDVINSLKNIFSESSVIAKSSNVDNSSGKTYRIVISLEDYEKLRTALQKYSSVVR